MNVKTQLRYVIKIPIQKSKRGEISKATNRFQDARDTYSCRRAQALCRKRHTYQRMHRIRRGNGTIVYLLRVSLPLVEKGYAVSSNPLMPSQSIALLVSCSQIP